ncbi:complement factor H-related protein 2-like [Trichomycterus rosablanca]|uniref:complement factor H-related protein 2-like n=1 Tax=Trichomycterus rosablanca TaxID=2290929 RepID=UPI002F360566
MRILFLALCVWTCRADRDLKCPKPALKNGFLVPDVREYRDGATVQYACNNGMRPPLETWWGEVRCERGVWSHDPLCIDATSCIAPKIPNGKPEGEPNPAYPDRSVVYFTCNKGYWFNGKKEYATCDRRRWTLPVCERKPNACGPPSRLENAMIKQAYQDIYEDGEHVEYVCRDDYELVGDRYSHCSASQWRPTPACVKREIKPKPNDPKTAESHQQPDATSCIAPKIPNGKPEEEPNPAYPDRSVVYFTCNIGYWFNGKKEYATCDRGRWMLPVCERSSTTEREAVGRSFLPVSLCGDQPYLENGDVSKQADDMALKLQCAKYYKLAGSDTVLCGADRQWTELPVCKPPCVLDRARFYDSAWNFDPYMQDGTERSEWCKNYLRGHITIRCVDGRALYNGCGYHDWVD